MTAIQNSDVSMSSLTVVDPGSPRKGVPTPEFGAKISYLARFFAKNCMKMKEIGPRGGAHP